MSMFRTFAGLFRKEKIVLRLFTVLLLLFSAYFLFWVFRGFLSGLTYPKEKLELSNINFTNALLNGRNPYLLENVAGPGEEPPVVYMYPFVNNLIAAGLSFIFGGNAFLAHYVLSFAAMLLSGLLGAAIVTQYSRTTVGPALSFILIMFCHWRYGYTSAAPDAFGLLLTLFTLYLATRRELKHRPFWCAVGIVTLFYVKQYFVSICISIFLFMWIRSKKEAIRLFLFCLLFTVSSVLLIAWAWPLYWDYTVVLMLYDSNVMNGTEAVLNGAAVNGWQYYLDQLVYLSKVFCCLYAAIAVCLGAEWLGRRKGEAGRDTEDRSESARTLFGIQVLVQFVVLLYFGRHDGAYLTYFLQLFFPSVIIYALILLEQTDLRKKEWIYIGCYMGLALFTVYFGWKKLPMHLLTEEERGQWNEAYEIMDRYRGKGEISNYFSTAFEGAKKGDPLFGTSHDAGAMPAVSSLPFTEEGFGKVLFPYTDLVFDEYRDYKEVVLQRIRDRHYALVTCPRDGGWMIPEELLAESGYQKIGELDLQMGNMTYPTDFWAVP
ncbi:MAG: hypothetical protein K6G83_10745 [Lachnospiraceae bacterium]|nr:hypothetical protein [Lachnospiraceae bacterium]